MAVPGWTLPGVMPAGAAQILTKTAGLLRRAAVLAGSGPLLYLLAAQMIDAGAAPLALLETQTPVIQLCALPHLPRALLSAQMLLTGLGLLRKIRAAGVPRHTAAHQFRAVQTDTGTIQFSFTAKGRSHQLETPLLLTHQGVIPATHISRAAGISQHWNHAQQAMQPQSNPWGRTSIRAVGCPRYLAPVRKTRRRRPQPTRRTRSRRADPRHPPLSGSRLCARAGVSGAPRQDHRQPLRGNHRRPDPPIPDQRHQRPASRQNRHPRRNGPCQGRVCEASPRGILAECGVIHQPARVGSPIKPILLGELAALAQSSNSQPSG